MEEKFIQETRRQIEALITDSNDWKLYCKRGEAYYYLGYLSRAEQDYLNAIEDFSKAIQLSGLTELHALRGTTYYDMGTVYHDQGNIDQAEHFFRMAIEDTSKVILSNKATEGTYYVRGAAYRSIDRMKNKLEYSKNGLHDYSKAINYGYKKNDIYFKRGRTYLVFEEYNKADLDYFSGLHIQLNSQEIVTTEFIDYFEKYPYSYKLFIDYCASKGKNVNIYYYTYTRIINEIYDFLVILEHMQFDAENADISKDVSIRKASILIFYLDGFYTTFKILDEQDIEEMSAQEIYYYYLSSQKFSIDSIRNIGIESIIEEIESRYALSDLDKYYLGQIYYMRSYEDIDEEIKNKCKEKAKELFNTSKTIIWSKAMLGVLDDSTNYNDEVIDYINSNCNQYKEISIEYNQIPINSAGNQKKNVVAWSDGFWMQFENYYHLQEISITNSSCLFVNPIQKVFSLPLEDLKNIEKEIYENDGNKIFEEISKRIAIKPLSQEEEDIFNDLKIKNEMLECGDFEEFAQIKIEDTKYRKEQILVLLRYLALNDKIDKKTYLTLLIYHILYRGEEKEYNDIRKYVDLSMAIISTIVFSPIFVKVIVPVITHLMQKRGSKVSYSKLKREMWIVMNNMYGSIDISKVDILKM